MIGIIEIKMFRIHKSVIMLFDKYGIKYFVLLFYTMLISTAWERYIVFASWQITHAPVLSLQGNVISLLQNVTSPFKFSCDVIKILFYCICHNFLSSIHLGHISITLYSFDMHGKLLYFWANTMIWNKVEVVI